MFDMQNVSGEDVKATCSFDYKGYVISMSSIFKPKDVSILLNEQFVGNKLASVQAAIGKIDELTDISVLLEGLNSELEDGTTVIEYLKLTNPILIKQLKETLEKT